ncbi:uncharacterized protein LOC119685625 [Teleopsis dalmanni]|uniref:uncharacterized protein LOC119685625 n=1 Tax=Teleopsis dalmanni TaxID=139649 RepID=UPI0018CF6EB7|nr:uncharacterized protein LOC119685625 [Teleopsis dalmanni]
MENKVWNIMRPYFNSLTILRWQILPDYSLIAIPLPKCSLIRIPIELLPIDSIGTPLISERSKTKYINLKQFLSKISKYKSIPQIGRACQILNKILTLNNNKLGSTSTKNGLLTYRKLNTRKSNKKQLIFTVEKSNSEPLNYKQLSNKQTSSNICNQHFNDLISKLSRVENMICNIIENKNEFSLMAIKDKLITNEYQDNYCQISNEESTISENDGVKKELILIYSRDHKDNRMSCFDETMSSDILTTGNEPLRSERNFDKISVKTTTSSKRSVDFKQLIMSKKQNSEQTQTCTNMSNDFNQLTHSNVYVDNRRLILNYSNSVQINIERLGRSDSDTALHTFWTGSEQSTSEMESSDQISSLEHCISYNFTDEEQFTETPGEIDALNNAIILSCMFILVIFLGVF